MEDRMPHEEERRGWFDEVAEKAGAVISGTLFFFTCVVLVVVWLPTLWVMGPEASQFMLQTVIAVVTLLMVALLQNSQKRSEDAVNLKLDAIAQAIGDLMRHHKGDDNDLGDNIDRLAKTVGLEERVTTRKNRTVDENGSNGRRSDESRSDESRSNESRSDESRSEENRSDENGSKDRPLRGAAD